MNAPAGWYPDSQQPGQQRYWDGAQWTEHRAPLVHAPPSNRPDDPDSVGATGKVPMFGARKALREAQARDEARERTISDLRTEAAELRAALERTGALDVVALEREKDALTASIEEARNRAERERDAHRKEAEAAAERFNQASKEERERVEGDLKVLRDRYSALQRQTVATEELSILQEVGVYEYRHPLQDSVEYRDELSVLQGRIKSLARQENGAVTADQGWTVNGSAAQGRAMIRNYSKLMLRAYNAEADNLVRGLKPYKLESAVDRLEKVTATIERLGKTMKIGITSRYHQLRIRELELTADFQEKLAREKEAEREEKQRLREERKAQQEMERERERLQKERDHYSNVLERLREKGDVDGAVQIEERLADVARAIEDVDYRAANVRAGYVYVISNLGAFGERMVKIGMTRRLDPMDRVKELGDASVPFNFDVHALFFSDDAVGIESAMHQRLADRRVNQVNLRREFFYATPAETKTLLLELAGNLLQFDEQPTAVEFRQSQHQQSAALSELDRVPNP